jgi:hypothetical protein
VKPRSPTTTGFDRSRVQSGADETHGELWRDNLKRHVSDPMKAKQPSPPKESPEIVELRASKPPPARVSVKLNAASLAAFQAIEANGAMMDNISFSKPVPPGARGSRRKVAKEEIH